MASELAEGLDEMGIDVVGPVPGVDEAFDAIHANEDVDAAILDINLGGQMVFPIADELDRRSIPFIFATAFEPNVVPDRHADELVLRKPLEITSVASALSWVLISGRQCWARANLCAWVLLILAAARQKQGDNASRRCHKDTSLMP